MRRVPGRATVTSGPRRRPYLLTHPGLPRTGQNALPDHQNPEFRVLAAADATLDEPPVAMLSDPDARVRRATGANPRCSRRT
nr:hypothetical protein OG781_20260 [Streptomyces sp. NBC_00830]